MEKKLKQHASQHHTQTIYIPFHVLVFSFYLFTTKKFESIWRIIRHTDVNKISCIQLLLSGSAKNFQDGLCILNLFQLKAWWADKFAKKCNLWFINAFSNSRNSNELSSAFYDNHEKFHVFNFVWRSQGRGIHPNTWCLSGVMARSAPQHTKS